MSGFKTAIVSGLLGVAALAGATAAQAQVTIGAPMAPGVYGQVVIGGGPVPALYAPTPVVVQPATRRLQPVYMYVPERERRSWSSYCGRYNACNRPVYFVKERPGKAKKYRKKDKQWYGERHDNGRHEGWNRGRGNPHRDR